MDEGELGLFTAALGLSAPWRVTRTAFDGARLDLYLDFPRGARFPCPAKDCAEGACAVHDTADKTWRHMDFFQHKAFLHARLPRVCCPEHGVRQVGVSWARPGSGFTMLFEALALTFVAAMPVAKVGMDETSARKRQDYVSVFADMARGRVLFATEGRSSETVARFAVDLAEHGGDPASITDTSSDMSTAFISGIAAHLPNATMTFDKFHIAATLSEAVDAVRRTEVTTRPELKHTRWLWLKNHASLSAKQPRPAPRADAALGQARDRPSLRWKEDFQAFYDQDPSYAPEYLRRWCSGAKRSRLKPLKDFVTLVEKHWDGIIAWHTNHLTNGLLEGINSLVQAAKARARSYPNKNKMITIIYLTAAKLPLPTLTNPKPAYMP